MKAWGKFAAAVAVAVALGLLEASWTTPDAPGATRPMLGSFGIAVVMLVVCWPRIWWAPGLSMLEEVVQIVFGQDPAIWPDLPQALFGHWSAAFTPVNLYPYLTFPLISIVGELIFQYRARTEPARSHQDTSPSRTGR